MSERSDSPEMVEAPLSAPAARTVFTLPGFLSPGDVVIAPALLAATLAVCFPIAMRLHADARKLDQATLASRERCEKTRVAIQRVEEHRALAAERQRAATRYLVEVDSHPVIPWPTVVADMCRNRPRGLWAVQLRGNGPRFQAVVEAARPDLVAAYARKLAKSPRAEFAARPGDGSSLQVVGRWRGE